jgi:hypothetical protein
MSSQNAIVVNAAIAKCKSTPNREAPTQFTAETQRLNNALGIVMTEEA